MAWYHQAPSHYLSQYWPTWVNIDPDLCHYASMCLCSRLVTSYLWPLSWTALASNLLHNVTKATQIARVMGPTWGSPGSCRPQMGPILAPWTLLSGNTLCDNYSSTYNTGRILARAQERIDRCKNLSCVFCKQMGHILVCLFWHRLCNTGDIRGRVY